MSEIRNPVNVSYVDERYLSTRYHASYELPVPYVDNKPPVALGLRTQFDDAKDAPGIKYATYADSSVLKMSDIGCLVKFTFKISVNGEWFDENVQGIVRLWQPLGKHVTYIGAIYPDKGSISELYVGEPLDSTYVKGVSLGWVDGITKAPTVVYIADAPAPGVDGITLEKVEYVSFTSTYGNDDQEKLYYDFKLRLTASNTIKDIAVVHSYSYDSAFNDKHISELLLNDSVYISNVNVFEYSNISETVGRSVTTNVIKPNSIEITFSCVSNITQFSYSIQRVIPRGFVTTLIGNPLEHSVDIELIDFNLE